MIKFRGREEVQSFDVGLVADKPFMLQIESSKKEVKIKSPVMLLLINVNEFSVTLFLSIKLSSL